MADNEGFEPVAHIAEIQDGGVLSVARASGERICLIRRGDRVTAVSDTCTHQEFAISLGDILPDGTIQCAWHGARFDCETGAVLQVPATEPLPVYQVRVAGGRVLVGAMCPRSGAGFEPSIARAGDS